MLPHVQWCYHTCSDVTTCRHTLSTYLPEISLLPLPALILIHFTERYIQRKVMPDWILKRKEKKTDVKLSSELVTLSLGHHLFNAYFFICAAILEHNWIWNQTTLYRPPGIRATSHQSQIPENKTQVWIFLWVVKNYWGCVHSRLLGGCIVTIKRLTNTQPAAA